MCVSMCVCVRTIVLFLPHKYTHPLSHTPTHPQLLHSKGLNLNAARGELWTALHYAAQHQHYLSVAELAKMGADMNAKNEEGDTPFALLLKYIESLNRPEALHTMHALLGSSARLDVENDQG